VRRKTQTERDMDACIEAMDANGMEEVPSDCYEWARTNKVKAEERGRFSGAACVGRVYFAPYWLAVIWRCFNATSPTGYDSYRARFDAARKAAADPKFCTKISAAYRLSGAEAAMDIIQGRDWR
jgi:hypothetical protein